MTNHHVFDKPARLKPWRLVSASALSGLLLFGQTAPVLGNPTGGTVIAGSASIGSAGKTLTINQGSNSAIINWQQFSINGGEVTKFIVPSSASLTLNRVIGGNPSEIFGTLQSNGQVFVINPNGIVVGAGGEINTAGFVGSTLAVSNQEFLKGGDLHFLGTSDASVENAGTIKATGGDVYLIASQVKNTGKILASHGNVGLAAGTDVFFQQSGDQHLFIQPTPSGAKRAIGVNNAGTIRAASVELKAAGGNAYALAINNSGQIAATGFKKINGQVYLVADGADITNSGQISARTASGNGGTIVLNGSGTASKGTVLNSGSLVASATAAGGQGGSVTLKNTNGGTIHTGHIVAQGGKGGTGGSVEISGAAVGFTGTVDLTASGGKAGNLLLDPATLDVITGGIGTVVDGQNDPTSTTIDPTAVENALATANLTLNANTNITVTDGITWTSSNTLTLNTNVTGSTINLNAPISGVNGGLTINTAGSGDVITPKSSVDVSSFILQNGDWTQNSATLPGFIASRNFTLENNSTFLRVKGGAGTEANPYQITDVYGLQGLDSPSGSLLTSNVVLVNDIDATGTSTWNDGAGFVPIGAYGGNLYTGIFNGQEHTINGLFINLPDNSQGTGLFGCTSGSSTIENLTLTGVNVTGDVYVGGLAGVNNATIDDVSSTGTVTGASYVGGLTGNSYAAISHSYSGGTVIGDRSSFAVGGLSGLIQGGSVTDCYSTADVTTGTGSTDVGGLVGLNGGFGAFPTISNSYSSGAINVGSGSNAVGGLVGNNSATITSSFWDTDTAGVEVGVGSGSSTGLTGATTSQLQSQSFIEENAPSWDFNEVWTTHGGTTLPEFIGFDALSGIAYTDSGVRIDPDALIDLIFDGTVIGSTTTSSTGTYTFEVNNSDLIGGILLTEANFNGDTYYQAKTPAAAITGVDLWGGNLRVLADVASNHTLGVAVGSLTGDGINYTVTGANLTTNADISLGILSNYTLGGNTTASGYLTTYATADLTGNSAATLEGSAVLLTGAMDSSGALTVKSTSGEIKLVDFGSPTQAAQASGITLDSASEVVLDDSDFLAGSGGFTAIGQGLTNASSTANTNGILVEGTTIQSFLGDITLTGTAGYSIVESAPSIAHPASEGEGETVNAGYGVHIIDSSVLETNGGSITVTGTGSIPTNDVSTGDLEGLYIDQSSLRTTSGNITLTGNVRSGTGTGKPLDVDPSLLVGVFGLVILQSGIETSGSGSTLVTLSGNTSGSETYDAYDDAVGVGAGSQIDSSGGISITGTAGNITTDDSAPAYPNNPGSNGVILSFGADLVSDGASGITIAGTGGSNTALDGALTGTSSGVTIFNAEPDVDNSVTALNGSISIHGVAGSSPNQAIGVNILGVDGGANLLQTESGGNISITGSGGSGYSGTGQVVGNYFPNAGIAITDSSSLLAGPYGNVILNGTGGGGKSPSVAIAGIALPDGGSAVAPTIEANNFDVNNPNKKKLYLDGDIIAGNVAVTSLGAISLGLVDADTVTLSGADISQIGPLITSDLTITSADQVKLTNAGNQITDLGDITTNTTPLSSSNLSISSSTSMTIQGQISAAGTVVIQDLGGNLTIGQNGSVSSKKDINLVAIQNFINNGGASAIDLLSPNTNYYIYSATPTGIQLGGLTPNFTQLGTTYPAQTFPSGNGVFYSYSPMSGGNGVPPIQSIITTINTQNNQISPQPVTYYNNPGDIIQPVNYTGSGVFSDTGDTGSLADSSGNGGNIGSGDAAQLGSNGLNNVTNPAAASALDGALSFTVHATLNDALNSLGDWTDTGTATTSGNPTAKNQPAETLLGAGDVAQVEVGSVKNIPLSQAPKQLQDAMGNGVRSGLSGSGTGH